jgi:hypothetical protein
MCRSVTHDWKYNSRNNISPCLKRPNLRPPNAPYKHKAYTRTVPATALHLNPILPPALVPTCNGVAEGGACPCFFCPPPLTLLGAPVLSFTHPWTPVPFPLPVMNILSTTPFQTWATSLIMGAVYHILQSAAS